MTAKSASDLYSKLVLSTAFVEVNHNLQPNSKNPKSLAVQDLFFSYIRDIVTDLKLEII